MRAFEGWKAEVWDTIHQELVESNATQASIQMVGSLLRVAADEKSFQLAVIKQLAQKIDIAQELLQKV